MGIKLLWTGLVLVVALGQTLTAFGVANSPVLGVVGAILMVIGLVLMWLDR